MLLGPRHLQTRQKIRRNLNSIFWMVVRCFGALALKQGIGGIYPYTVKPLLKDTSEIGLSGHLTESQVYMNTYFDPNGVHI